MPRPAGRGRLRVDAGKTGCNAVTLLTMSFWEQVGAVLSHPAVAWAGGAVSGIVLVVAGAWLRESIAKRVRLSGDVKPREPGCVMLVETDSGLRRWYILACINVFNHAEEPRTIDRWSLDFYHRGRWYCLGLLLDKKHWHRTFKGLTLQPRSADNWGLHFSLYVPYHQPREDNKDYQQHLAKAVATAHAIRHSKRLYVSGEYTHGKTFRTRVHIKPPRAYNEDLEFLEKDESRLPLMPDNEEG